MTPLSPWEPEEDRLPPASKLKHREVKRLARGHAVSRGAARLEPGSDLQIPEGQNKSKGRRRLLWALVAEAEFGARARRDRPRVSVPALLPCSVGPATPGTSTLGPGSRRPAGPARPNAGRAGWTGSESQLPVEDAGRVASASFHPQAKRSEGKESAPRHGCRGSVSRGQRARQGLGQHWVGGRGETQREGATRRPFPSDRHGARAAPCAGSGGHPETQHFLGAAQGDMDLPYRPGTNFHVRPQTTVCYHLSSRPAGEAEKPSGCWREVWV